MTNKEYFGAGIFSVCTLAIGIYAGKEYTESKLKPRIENHLERIKYLENGITKN